MYELLQGSSDLSITCVGSCICSILVHMSALVLVLHMRTSPLISNVNATVSTLFYVSTLNIRYQSRAHIFNNNNNTTVTREQRRRQCQQKHHLKNIYKFTLFVLLHDYANSFNLYNEGKYMYLGTKLRMAFE